MEESQDTNLEYTYNMSNIFSLSSPFQSFSVHVDGGRACGEFSINTAERTMFYRLETSLCVNLN